VTPPNPMELLESQRMGQLVDQLKEQADVVLFDSPPLLSVADASIVAAKMDGVVLVVDVEKTRAPALVSAVEMLKQSGVHILGVALNKAKNGRSGGNYYRHYEYTKAPEKSAERGAAGFFDAAGQLSDGLGSTVSITMGGTPLRKA
jgi:Mrp family chromosome partitioning ATPase